MLSAVLNSLMQTPANVDQSSSERSEHFQLYSIPVTPFHTSIAIRPSQFTIAEGDRHHCANFGIIPVMNQYTINVPTSNSSFTTGQDNLEDTRSSRPNLVKGQAFKSDMEEDQKIQHRKRKRNRTIRSCVSCHVHKRKVRFGFFLY